jgi:hypothetical protein
MASLQPFLNTLLSSLPAPPIPKAQLETLARKTLDESSGKSSPENRKSQWEYLLKNEIFKLAVRGLLAHQLCAHMIVKDVRGRSSEEGGLSVL